MKVTETSLSGVLVLEPMVFKDSRGSFMEFYNEKNLEGVLPNLDFVQENVSISAKNVLRGLHFQNPPHAQAKLVTVLCGAAYDVIVDIRKKSPTYGEWFGLELTEKNKKQLYVPRGFAHGFVSLEDDTLFHYKCDNYYHKPSEDALLWNDTELNITWPISSPILSEKDEVVANRFSSYNSQF